MEVSTHVILGSKESTWALELLEPVCTSCSIDRTRLQDCKNNVLA